MSEIREVDVAFIGSAGVPNRYGGFEAFLEYCGPHIANNVRTLYVTCDAALYDERTAVYDGMHRVFVCLRSNGAASVFHDLFAFFHVFPKSSHIVVLGVSGAPWFPIFRCLCSMFGKRLMVNIDGVEWRRDKFSRFRRLILRGFDWLAQRCAHMVIYDNAGLKGFVRSSVVHKSVEIAYSGDHVFRDKSVVQCFGSALTVCRIEPENQVEMLIKGMLSSSLVSYTIVGNWNSSEFGRDLRSKYHAESRLQLLDPVYDSVRLGNLRESCQFYLHGHSVGGTNPSLVEMIFYECHLLCFDVVFNRVTAGVCANYFSDEFELARILDRLIHRGISCDFEDRVSVRSRYTSENISRAYLSILD